MSPTKTSARTLSENPHLPEKPKPRLVHITVVLLRCYMHGTIFVAVVVVVAPEI